MKLFSSIIKRDFRLIFRGRGAFINYLMFFVVSAVLFPFGVGPDNDILAQIGVGVICVCALLTSLLSAPLIFDEDYEDGSLAQLFLQGYLPEFIVLSKIFSHWLTAGLPIVLVAPLLSLFFHIEHKIPYMLITLLVATPTLSMIGSVGAALTLGLKRVGGLLGVLTLPLYIPVLIFAVSAVDSDKFYESIMFLIGIFLLMVPVSIYASVFGVNAALEDN